MVSKSTDDWVNIKINMGSEKVGKKNFKINLWI